MDVWPLLTNYWPAEQTPWLRTQLPWLVLVPTTGIKMPNYLNCSHYLQVEKGHRWKIEHKKHLPSVAVGRIWVHGESIVTLRGLPRVRGDLWVHMPPDTGLLMKTWPHLQRSSSRYGLVLVPHSVFYSLHRQCLLPGTPASQLNTQPCKHEDDDGYQAGPR